MLALLAVWTIALVVSAIGASDLFTWALEVAPAIIGVAALAATYRRFPFTNLVYGLVFVHSLILMRTLHLRQGTAGVLDAGRLSLQPQPLRPHRPLRSGLCAGDDRAGDLHPQEGDQWGCVAGDTHGRRL